MKRARVHPNGAVSFSASWTDLIGVDTDNYLVTGEQPADRIRVIGNVGYKAGGGRPNLRLAPQVPMSGTASIRDNCLDIRQTLAAAKPVLEATYHGAAVSLPRRRDAQTPSFDAFLILPAVPKKGTWR
jgi:hypothetical protein